MKRYKLPINNIEILAYGEGNLNPSWEAQLLEENVDPSKYKNLQIIHIPESNLFKVRTRDKRLEDEHILSFEDLSYAYFLIKINSLQKSKSVRDAVIEKYSEVIEFVKNETSD